MTSEAVTTQEAQEALKSIMIGAYLEEIRTHSIQTTLRFFSDQVRIGERIAVDLIFVCEAGVSLDDLSIESGGENFFSGRARFLSQAYGLIGREISELHLQDSGALTIRAEASSIFLWLSNDDYGDDDWAWMVKHEQDPSSKTRGADPVYCMPEGDGVRFYVGV